MKQFKSICIIDDDKVYTFGVKKLIKSALPDHKFYSFDNGKEAIEGISEMLEKGEDLPDLILLDIDMPQMNGWEFLLKFEPIRNAIEKKIEVFVISSRLDESKQDLYKIEWDEQVSDFIKKPVAASTIRQILE